MTGYLDTAREVIAAEAAALELLSDTLDDRFDAAVGCILQVTGRVIVTGIGKSGHIARKIAATFASTGTPAQFVHPAEASHGDMGMITQKDIVLAISNSGEAPELANLLAFSRRFRIPLLGITSKPDSTLAKQSDILLQLPQVTEACGTGVVPTSSTTVTLALGDALAVALMKHRDFTAEHFRDFHPGGKLGAQLSRVQDLMQVGDDLPLVTRDTPMPDALLEMSQKNFGVIGVTDPDGGLAGIITDGDLRRRMVGLLELKAGDVMTPNPRTIDSQALVATALAEMKDRKITCLFVVDNDGTQAKGLIRLHDCLRAGLV